MNEKIETLLALRAKSAAVAEEMAAVQDQIDAAVLELRAQREVLVAEIQPLENELREINQQIAALTR